MFSTTDLLCTLLQSARPRVTATLTALERDGALKSEELRVSGYKTRLWGITPHGLAVAGQFDAPFFEIGRTNAAYVPHRIETQRLRLAAEAADWQDWTPERVLRGQCLKKVPDAMVISPEGLRVAIEVERNCKTPKRYAELMLAYILEIKAGRVQEVHFVCPPGVASLVERSMGRVTEVRHAGERVPLTDGHRKRFRYFSFDEWPPKEIRT